jgi:F-type H+-transporting ATPase subunit b
VISLDKTLLIQMLNFLILLWILNRFFFKPILKILDERKARIEASEKSVQELEAKAKERWSAYQRQLQEAKLQATAERERIKGEALEEEKRMLEQVRAEAVKRVEETRRKLTEEVERARGALKGQIEPLALEMVERVLGRSLR